MSNVTGKITLTPELIEHTKFHTGKWLMPCNKKNWYYFAKSKSSHVVTNPCFIQTVDYQLKDIVQFLHAKNIETTPSCAGHPELKAKDAKAIYYDLNIDRNFIIRDGIEFIDVETGEYYLYKDDNYFLPWKEEEFVEKFLVYREKGVLGIYLDNHLEAKKLILNLHINGACFKEMDGITFIFTNYNCIHHNELAWEEITKQIKIILTS